MRRAGLLAVSPWVAEDYVLDATVAPEALAGRLRAAINTRPKRALGVLKVHSEWIGLVAGNEFVVWEKQQHATRATGRIRRHKGGARVEARIALTRRTSVLMVVFFTLFAVAALGLLAREEGLGIGPTGLGIAVVGGLVTLTLFWWAGLRQRAALRRFLDEVFREREPA